MSRKYNVSFEIELDDRFDDVDVCDIESWLQYELGEYCSLEGENPLSCTDIQSQTVKRVWV